jgi:predicted nucleic acid-binding protein
VLYLLDTDVAIDLLRGHPPAMAWEAALDAADELAMSGYTAIELVDGCANKLDTRRVLAFIDPFRLVWPLPADSARGFAYWPELRLTHGVSVGDVLIAETAKGLGVPLHTFNRRHFVEIPDLDLREPYAR